MGYSLSVRFASQKERDEMLGFLSYQNFENLQKINKHISPAEPVGGCDVSYPPKAPLDCIIGFNGSSIPHYVWAVGCWMASKSTYRSKGEMVIFYDDEKLIVDQTKGPNPVYNAKSGCMQVDEQGIVINPPQTLGERLRAKFIGFGFRENLKAERAFLLDLDDNWTTLNTISPQRPHKCRP